MAVPASHSAHKMRSGVRTSVWRSNGTGYPVSKSLDSFNCRSTLIGQRQDYVYYSLPKAEANGLAGVSKLPYSMKVLLENLLRFEDGRSVTKENILAVAEWLENKGLAENEIAYRPARVLMQDFTGVPAVVDLAAMRDAMVSLGGDPEKINPLVPVDLVIDHSVIVDEFGTPTAFASERRARIRAQRRALPLPEVGPAGIQEFPRRSSRHRHLSPGESRISRPDRLDQGRRRRDHRLSGYLRRHRLATRP